MRVYRCDRCGDFFERKDLLEMVTPRNQIAYTFKIKRHVCKDCANSFYHWWRNPQRVKLECLVAPKSSELTAKLLRNEVRNG